MSDRKKPLDDAVVRRRAATDFRTNLVVLAGAGTGKTSLLIERLLNAIAGHEIAISAIAAITFTEKAAGEMRLRLALGLDRLRGLARGEVEPGGDDEADRAFAWLTSESNSIDNETIAARSLAAMEQLDRARVTTIHSFCSELLRAHAVEARVDPEFAVDNGEHATTLRDALWEEFLSRELGPEAPRAETWLALLEQLPLATVSDVAKGLTSFRVPVDRLAPPYDSPGATELLGPEASEVIDQLDRLLSRQSGMTKLALRCFGDMRGALQVFLDEGLDRFRATLAAAGDLQERVDSRKGWPRPPKKLCGVTAEEWKSVEKRACGLARSLLYIDDDLVAAILPVVAPFARDFREKFLRQGNVGFDGLLALTRDLLRDSPKVRRSVKERFRMLLVDEFQDTDPGQHEIVLFLGETLEGDAATAYGAELEPGRLFVVGDPKQSIYRFRGADYSAYRRAVDRIVTTGGEELELVTNFRSVPGLVDPVNRLFGDPSGCWAATDDGEHRYQPAYGPIRAHRPPSGQGPATEIWTVSLPRGARASERRDAEGEAIATEIDRIVREGTVPHKGITIIFRAFTNIVHYLRPLRERGIPFVVDGGRDFLIRPEVGQLLATLRTLAQPSDPVALLAFLRSPAGAVSDIELAAFTDDGAGWDWREPVESERHPRIATCFELLRQLSDETRHLPADAVVRRTLGRSLLLPLGGAAYEGAQRVANLEKLASAAGELARDGRLSLDEVVEALKEGRLADIETDRPLSDDAADAVRITTIHKMKGLENDWIFIPDLARSESSGHRSKDAVRIARTQGGDEALALTAGSTINAASAWLDAENDRHGLAEEVRVLYVAATRAREHCVLLAGPGRGTSSWVEALGSWGYDADNPPNDGDALLDGAVDHRNVVPRTGRATRHDTPPVDVRQQEDAYRESRESLAAAARPPLAAPSGLREAVDTDSRSAETGRTPAGRDLGRSAGIVVHRWLERRTAGTLADEQNDLDPLCEMTAANEGVDARALLNECHAILGAFADSSLGKHLMEVETIGREVPILHRDEEGRNWRGNIDLIYRDTNGELVVVDYKTDREADAELMRAKYRGQLELYADAIRCALELPSRPRAELWLLRTGRRVTVC